MTNHAELVARLLEKHADIAHIEQPAATLVKRDQLLVLDRHAGAVEEAARRYVDRREDLAELGIARLHLRPGSVTDAGALVHELRGGAQAHRRTSVTPNHVLRGTPGVSTGGPFGEPKPTAALPAPAANGNTGRRAVVGILDTGIDPHPWFADTAWYAECGPEEHEHLDRHYDYHLDSEAGHGTFIAGVVLQQAPAAHLRVERIMHPDGIADEVDILKGLARVQKRCTAASDRLDILNLSLGCFTFDDRPSPVLADAIARVARNTVVIASAGNDDSDRPFWPAALKEVIGVAALAKDATPDAPHRAPFSNYGWWIDASAPGEDVASSFLTIDEDGKRFHGYATWNGTSFAAPYLAGSIAALMSAKDMTAHDAAAELLDPTTGTRIPDLGIVVGPGTARP